MKWILGSVGLAIIAALLATSAVSLHADLAQISLAPLAHALDLLLLAAGLTVINYVLRIIRWRWYLTTCGRRLPYGFLAMTYIAGFAFKLSPGGVGEIIKARYYTAVGTPAKHVVAAFTVERLMDLLSMLALAALAISAFPGYKGFMWIALIAVLVGFGFLIALPSADLVSRFGLDRRYQGKVGRGAVEILTTIKSARALLHPKSAFPAFLIGTLACALEGLGLSVVTHIISPGQTSGLVAIGIFAASVIVGVFSFVPGGLGSTEAAMTALLVTQKYSVPDAISIALTCRVVTFWLSVCLGWLAVGLLRTRITTKLSSSLDKSK